MFARRTSRYRIGAGAPAESTEACDRRTAKVVLLPATDPDMVVEDPSHPDTASVPQIKREDARAHSWRCPGFATIDVAAATVVTQSGGRYRVLERALEARRGPLHGRRDPHQQEETLLREFRNRLTLEPAGIDRKAAEQSERASTNRLMLDAPLNAIAMETPETHLNELTKSLRQSGLHWDQQAGLLVRTLEVAVEGTLEDGLLTLRSLHRPDLNPRKESYDSTKQKRANVP